MTGTSTAPAQAHGATTAAISNLMVGLLSRYTGRGLTKARTYFNDDLVTIVLGETLTKAEHTLVDNDHSDVVLATRKTFQDVIDRARRASSRPAGRGTAEHAHSRPCARPRERPDAAAADGDLTYRSRRMLTGLVGT
jgi:hypothetical protein